MLCFFGGVDLIIGTMIGKYRFFFSGVALIVGIMTGDYSFVLQWGGPDLDKTISE
jgi:hypothetical protein